MVGYVLITVAATGVFFAALLLYAGQRGLVIGQTWRPPRPRRLSALTESLGYVGVILVLAAVGAGLGQRWDALAPWQRPTVLAMVGLALLAIGYALRRLADPVFERFTGFSWFVSTAAMAAAAGVAAHDLAGQQAAVTAVAVGSAVTVYATALWLLRRRELEMAAFFIGLIVTVCAAVPAVGGAALPWLTVPLGFWMAGVAWAILGWQYPEPLWTSVPFGTAVALVAPALAAWRYDWVYLIGIGTGALTMAAGIRVRSKVPLAFGALAVYGYGTWAIFRYFHAALGIPESLAVSGAFLIGLAAVTARLRRRRQVPPGPRPPAAGPPGIRPGAPPMSGTSRTRHA